MNNIQDTLTYKGSVKISLKVKDKIVEIARHNRGTLNLYKVFAKALLGEYDNSKMPRPKYLDLRYGDFATDDGVSILYSPISLTGSTYNLVNVTETSQSASATFTGAITYSNINKPIAQTGYTYRLYLSDSASGNLLAWIEIEEEELEKIEPGTQALVQWSMTLLG